jgi:glycosyltransferase involved in cell wall biosynthesis
VRILHVIQPPKGGAPTVVRMLVRFQATSHEVGVVCHPAGVFPEHFASEGARVWRLAMDRPVRPLDDVRNLRRLKKVIREFRPDVIHAHSSKAGVLARLAGRSSRTPVVLSPHNFAYRAYEGSAAARLVFFVIERLLAPLTSHLHAICEDEYINALRWRMASSRKSSIVPNGIDLDPFLGISHEGDSALVVGSYARLRPPKRHDLLLQAAAALAPAVPGFEVAIIGEGPQRPELEEMAREVGLADRTRFLDDPGPVGALSDIDIFVLASSHEVYPIALMEAMAAGCAVVATAVGGVPEMIDHGRTGLLVPPGRADRLAEELERMLKDDDLRARLADAARREARSRFTAETMAKAIEAMYVDVVGGEESPRELVGASPREAVAMKPTGLRERS